MLLVNSLHYLEDWILHAGPQLIKNQLLHSGFLLF